MKTPDPIRAIAYYLPQFHPIPENDAWWGKGFTEWTNVAKARPLFRGHYQPQLPADMGFYDPRLPEVREEQANLAREHGLEGFCYWHYWFHGVRLLNRPVDDMLASGRPDFPFCLAWANESWSRRWTGEEKEILLAQTYSPEDDLNHARWLAGVFADRRYLRVDGRPLFVLYRPPSLPDARRTTDTLRGECVRLGLKEPYIVGRDTHSAGVDMRAFGCDITESSSPNFSAIPGAFAPEGRLADWRRNARLGRLAGDLKVFDYEQACQLMERARPPHPYLPGFLVGWDNSPRRGRKAIILARTSPEAFGRGLRAALQPRVGLSTDHRLVFINAWNEWAEGMHLEPDQLHGRRFLEALKSVLDSTNSGGTSQRPS